MSIITSQSSFYSSELTSAGYIFNPEKQVWCQAGYASIRYNDGDGTESRISNIIAQAKDVSLNSLELSSYCVDWPSRYHLSKTRVNILRPFSHLLKGDVLEIGAGCGAITRYLGEVGGTILALEGSVRRATMARSRTRDLPNVTVLAEKFDQFQCEYKFDVITLIGVLEYANLFTTGENPPLSMLKRVKELLKPNGKLIIAIENQFGLKYFAGALEDHIGKAMYGIEGRYQKDHAETFGRKVLDKLLKQAGFDSREFLAPFPDYKLPVSILTEKACDNPNFDAAIFACQSVQRDPQLPKKCYFSPELAWPGLFQNGLAMDLANSFLIAASPSNQTSVNADVLAYHYTSNRISDYCKEIEFVEKKERGIEVISKPLFHKTSQASLHENIHFHLVPVAPYIVGEPLSLAFTKIITKNNWSMKDVVGFIKKYLEILKFFAQQRGVELTTNDLSAKIPGWLFDVIPSNIIIQTDGEPALIDHEWEVRDLELGELLYRSLFYMLNNLTFFGEYSAGKKFRKIEFIHHAINAAGFQLKKTILYSYARREAEFQSNISGGQKHYLSLIKIMREKLQTLSPPTVGLKGQIFAIARRVLVRFPGLKVVCSRMVKSWMDFAASRTSKD